MSFVKIFPFLLFHPFEISLVQSGKETAENNTQYKQEMTLSPGSWVSSVKNKKCCPSYGVWFILHRKDIWACTVTKEIFLNLRNRENRESIHWMGWTIFSSGYDYLLNECAGIYMLIVIGCNGVAWMFLVCGDWSVSIWQVCAQGLQVEISSLLNVA